MVNIEQISAQVMKNTAKLSALDEGFKTVVKRMNDTDAVINVIHKIAGSIETLTIQVAQLTRSVERQGERIGGLESKPGKRWEAAAAQVLSLVIAAAVGGFIMMGR